MQPTLNPSAEPRGWAARLPVWLSGRRALWGILGVAPLVIVATLVLRPSREAAVDQTVYKVRPMPLVVNVLAGGSLTSTGSLEIKSQVEGNTTIISVVPEGTIITEEDVAAGKVLIELDSSALREKANQQDVTVQSCQASFTQARESFEIQKNLNDSNIKAAELKMKFARYDLEKYVGASVAEKLLKEEFKLDTIRASTPEKAAQLLSAMDLGGAARQQWRKLQGDIDYASGLVSKATNTYDWSKRLAPKGYISGSELEADGLDLKSKQLTADQARLALDIFLQYEFAKTAEQALSDYREACRNLEREQAKARAEISKAEANLKSNEATFLLQKDRLAKLQQQIANCVVKATRPGMVVYPSTSGGRWGGSDKIEEGATVRERQVLLTIPDSNNMSVNTKVHETAVNKVKVGQEARVVPDGFPDMVLWGKVQKVAVLAEQQSWMSPDVKVYNVTVALGNPPASLKPGMSAQVEIIVDRLANVLAVPVQAVSTQDGKRVCYVLRDGKSEPRVVETGQFNDNFIEVQRGLSAGESVLLRTPVAIGESAANGADKGDHADAAGKGGPAAKGAAAEPPAKPDAAGASPAAPAAAQPSGGSPGVRPAADAAPGGPSKGPGRRPSRNRPPEQP